MTVRSPTRPDPEQRQGHEPLLALTDIVKHFNVKRGLLGTPHTVHAIDQVSLDVWEGETLGVVGESGCGKSTLARVIVGLHGPTSGSVEMSGVDINGGSDEAALARDQLQMVFQDPIGSLNPRLTVGQSVAEPLRPRRLDDVQDRVNSILELVSLKAEHGTRLPHQLSGGQAQRACIARALISEAKLVVHDESVSALDVSLQAQVLNLLRDLQDRLGLTYVFISHDLATVQSISSRIAVMYLGKLVELAPTDRFHKAASHPYSIALRSAVPVPDPKVERRREQIILRGDVPSPLSPPAGCRFHTRCPAAQEVCAVEEPPLMEHGSGHWVACHFAGGFDSRLTLIPSPDSAVKAKES